MSPSAQILKALVNCLVLKDDGLKEIVTNIELFYLKGDYSEDEFAEDVEELLRPALKEACSELWPEMLEIASKIRAEEEEHRASA